MRSRRSLVLAGILLLATLVGIAAWKGSDPTPREGARREVGGSADSSPRSSGLAAHPRHSPPADEAFLAVPTWEEEGLDPPEPTDPAPRPAGWPSDAPTVLCRVRIVDAITGAPIDRRWHLRAPSSASPPPPPPGEWTRPAPEPPPGPPEVDDRIRSPGDAAAVLLHPPSLPPTPLVQLTDGAYVQWDDGGWERPWFTAAAGVEEVVLRVPLRRALTLEVEVLGPGGTPARGARLEHVRVDGRVLSHDSMGDAQYLVDDQGVASVSGVPLVPGAGLEGDVTWRPATTEGTGEALEESAYTPPLRLRIPPSVPTPWRVTLRLSGPTAKPHAAEDTDGDLPTEEDITDPTSSPEVPRGSVVVRALGCDGRPAAGARVEGPGPDRIADPTGHARFDGLPAGDARFTLAADGRFHASATVRVRQGAETAVTLVEPQGGRLELLVVDEDRRPCPSAILEILGRGSPSWFDVEGGVQRLDPYADENGHRTIARVAPGDVWVRATAPGGRTGVAQVLVRDDGTESLTLVVREPKAPDPGPSSAR